MNMFFCHKEDGLPVVVKIAINTAGYMIAKNNPELVKRALPVAKGILQSINDGADNGAMNALVAEAIATLVGKIDADPIIKAAVYAALSQLNINVEVTQTLTFTNDILIDILESFIAGLSTGV
jgi:hypothetical protein